MITHQRWTFILLTFYTAILSACSSLLPTEEIYIPPTLAASPIPLESPTPTSPPATPTPSCTNNLTFLEDLTIPDGTVVFSGSELDKRWLVENSGTCNWGRGYTLRLINEPNMGAPAIQSLFPARAGTETTIRIIYTAPEESGIYRSAWQAYDPQEQPFGDPIFIEIVVQ